MPTKLMNLLYFCVFITCTKNPKSPGCLGFAIAGSACHGEWSRTMCAVRPLPPFDFATDDAFFYFTQYQRFAIQVHLRFFYHISASVSSIFAYTAGFLAQYSPILLPLISNLKLQVFLPLLLQL